MVQIRVITPPKSIRVFSNVDLPEFEDAVPVGIPDCVDEPVLLLVDLVVEVAEEDVVGALDSVVAEPPSRDCVDSVCSEVVVFLRAVEAVVFGDGVPLVVVQSPLMHVLPSLQQPPHSSQ